MPVPIPEDYEDQDEPRTTAADRAGEARRNLEARIAVLTVTEELFENAQAFVARRLWCRYNALVAAGFTDDQAMALLMDWDPEDDE